MARARGQSQPDGVAAPSGPQAQQVDPEPLRVREAPLRRVLQAILAILAIGVFVLYVLVWRGDALSAEPGVFLPLLGLLLLLLLIEVFLLRPIYETMFRRLPLPMAPDLDNYVVGCPGCGTVFTVTEAELEEGPFACHNCGRPGYVKDYDLRRSAIQREMCRTCGNPYLEFLEHSECPVCHTFNEY